MNVPINGSIANEQNNVQQCNYFTVQAVLTCYHPNRPTYHVYIYVGRGCVLKIHQPAPTTL